MFKPAVIAACALLFSDQVLGTAFQHKNVARADVECPQLPSTNSGRKIAIVIDSSGSNVDTDPQNLRIAAGKNLVSRLVSKGQASNGGQPDSVTVIDFDFSASVIYPLGDPAGATSSFDSIDSSGGTDIASGVEAAIDELTKAKGDVTAGRSGIVVLTDGEDSSLASLLAQLARAKTAGIRVAFGFLSAQPPSSASDLLTAILDTGGIYSTITSDQAQEAFINLVINHGLTDVDGKGAGSGPQVLYPGLAIAGKVSVSDGPRTYNYNSGGNGEKLNFTVTALSGQTLDIKLRDTKGNKDLDSATTDQAGNAELLYTATQAVSIALEISTADTKAGLFTVGFSSSLGSSGNGTAGCKPRTPGKGGKGSPSSGPSSPSVTGSLPRPSGGLPYHPPQLPGSGSNGGNGHCPGGCGSGSDSGSGSSSGSSSGAGSGSGSSSGSVPGAASGTGGATSNNGANGGSGSQGGSGGNAGGSGGSSSGGSPTTAGSSPSVIAFTGGAMMLKSGPLSMIVGSLAMGLVILL